jgi:hypothetical protein
MKNMETYNHEPNNNEQLPVNFDDSKYLLPGESTEGYARDLPIVLYYVLKESFFSADTSDISLSEVQENMKEQASLRGIPYEDLEKASMEYISGSVQEMIF